MLFGKATENFNSTDIEQFDSSGRIKSWDACWVPVKSKTIMKWFGKSVKLIPCQLSM